MLALFKLPLPECATAQRVAVLIDAISEVLTVHADRSAFPPLQVSLVNEIPLLHNSLSSVQPQQHGCKGRCMVLRISWQGGFDRYDGGTLNRFLQIDPDYVAVVRGEV